MDKQHLKFKENLACYRKQKGLLQKTLAERLGVSTSAVSNWESGINFPRLDTVYNICDALEISISQLLEIDESKYTKEEQELIHAYNKNPLMQPAIRRLLGLSTDNH